MKGERMKENKAKTANRRTKMIKRIMVIIFTVLMAAVVFAADDTSIGTASLTDTASPNYAGKFVIGYNGGLNFRLFPSESWGLEIPVSGSYSNSPSISNPTSYRWSITSGINLLFPIKNNFGILICFEPGIILSGSETYYESANIYPGYYYNDGYGNVNKYDTYNYSFSGGITIGLEAELFLNKIYDKLPSNISIGSKIALTGTINLNENWDKNYYDNGITRNYAFVRLFGSSVSMLSSTNALTNFTIRYYF